MNCQSMDSVLTKRTVQETRLDKVEAQPEDPPTKKPSVSEDPPMKKKRVSKPPAAAQVAQKSMDKLAKTFNSLKWDAES